MRSLIAVAVGIFFLWAMWHVAQTGYARSMAENGSETRQLSLADEAVKLSPSDPETHYNRAALLWAAGDKAGAIGEAERTVALRPRDYFLWFRLGFYRYFSEDEGGALSPFREASRLAPYYAQPRWYLGELLVRQGRSEEGFAELRQAKLRDHTLDFTDLAWWACKGDVRGLEAAIRPTSADEQLRLAEFLVTQERVDDGMRLFRAGQHPSDESAKSLLTALLKAKQFAEAYEVWSRDRSIASDKGSITDGSFEDKTARDDPGFGWQFAREDNALQISLDNTNFGSGVRSLRLDFHGDSNPSTRVLSQVVLAEPNRNYRLSFSARTEDIVTGGSPVIKVLDATADPEPVLAESKALPQPTSDWQTYVVDFKTSAHIAAVLIVLQRQACTGSPCPAFGRLWLDDFVLKQI